MIEVYRVAAGSQYGFFEFEEESVCCFDEASEVVRKSSFAGFTRLDLEVGDRAAVNMHQRLAAARLMLALGERERAAFSQTGMAVLLWTLRQRFYVWKRTRTSGGFLGFMRVASKKALS